LFENTKLVSVDENVTVLMGLTYTLHVRSHTTFYSHYSHYYFY